MAPDSWDVRSTLGDVYPSFWPAVQSVTTGSGYFSHPRSSSNPLELVCVRSPQFCREVHRHNWDRDRVALANPVSLQMRTHVLLILNTTSPDRIMDSTMFVGERLLKR